MSRPALLTYTLLILACSSSEDPSGSGGSPTADAAPDVTAESAPDVTAETARDVTAETDPPDAATDVADEATPDGPAESSTDALASDAQPEAAIDAGPVSSCDQLNTVECFANHECETARRCEDVGPDGTPVPCCVVGVRGTGQAGDACADENDCESGVCIAGTGPYMCSQTCSTEADCPQGMKDCRFIAFSSSDDMWCFPTS